MRRALGEAWYLYSSGVLMGTTFTNSTLSKMEMRPVPMEVTSGPTKLLSRNITVPVVTPAQHR